MSIARRASKVFCSAIAAWCIIGSCSLNAAESTPEYLSDALSDRINSLQAWGEVGLNTAVKPTNGTAARLRIKDKEYQRGLGHHAGGEIVVVLDGLYKLFECEVGVQWQGGKSQGSVVFQVFVDDKKVFDSGVMRENDAAKKVGVPVENVETLRLVATDAGDGIAYDCADWADARLTLDPAAKGRIAQTAVDIAPFASVVSSDPKRMTGTAASRVQEIPAEDVFLETELKPAVGGGFSVPVETDAPSCIGLRWYEMRCLRRLELHWADATAIPAADAVQLQQWVGISPTQYWTGASALQGQWKPLPATLEQSQGVWSWQIANKDQPAGTYRVRWVFPASKQPIALKKISAFSRSSWTTADLRLESRQQTPRKQVQVVVNNGELLQSAGQVVAHAAQWDLSRPIDMKVRYSKPRPHKADRTVLRFELPGQPISVAVEDVVARGCVYVPMAGLFVTLSPPQMTLTQYLQQIAGEKTVLEQVRSQPDQTLSQAMAKTHNPAQANGPMLASLACDNRKYVVHRDGTISFHPADTPDGEYPRIDLFGVDPQARNCRQVVPRFGSGKNARLGRHLDGGWLPAPVTRVDEGGVVYSQRTYVAPVDRQPPVGALGWLRDRAACVAEYAVENSNPAEAEIALDLTFFLNGANNQRANFDRVKEGLLAVDGDRLFAMIETDLTAALDAKSKSGTIRLAGKLPAGGKARLFVYLPAWKLPRAEYAILLGGTKWMEATKAYWNDILRPAMQVELPDALLTNVIRASQVHCMLAARNEERGRYISPWISADRYGPLESESQAVIRGMDMTGCNDFARRGLEFFLKRYNAQGFLTTGYTLVGTGENLWTIAEHRTRCDDREWFSRITPQLVKTCKWIVAQREKTRRLDADGNKMPEYGLMPPGVTADWDRYAYRFYNDAQYCLGLEAIAQKLAAAGHPDAPALLADAKQYREDLLRAYRWTQARCPVVALSNGTWTPNHPAMLDVFGNVDEMVPAEDFNRSWCYSVEIGSHHLAANRLLDPNSAEVAPMMDYLEDHQFLRTAFADDTYYSEQRNRKDVFNLGGFSKVQPYYSRNAEIYALRDDVKPFVRSYFNALSSLLNDENLSFWEHFRNAGGWNKTHETGWFLCQTATMFVMERGDELWLAPMITNRWLEDGQTIAVRNAPTRFGPVVYRMNSHVRDGYIEASIEPPTRTPPKRVVIRIRHPEGKPMRSVTVDGKPHQDFDASKEYVSVQPTGGRVTVRAGY